MATETYFFIIAFTTSIEVGSAILKYNFHWRVSTSNGKIIAVERGDRSFARLC